MLCNTKGPYFPLNIHLSSLLDGLKISKTKTAALSGKELEREDALRVCGPGTDLTVSPNPRHLPLSSTHGLVSSIERSMVESKDRGQSGGSSPLREFLIKK